MGGKRHNLGVTIVELLIVLVIVAVLLLVALAMFKSVTGKARQTVASNALQQAASSLQEHSADTGTFAAVTTLAGDLAYDQPSLCVGTGASYAVALNSCPISGNKGQYVVLDSNSNAAGITSYSATSDGSAIVEMVTGPNGEQQSATISALASSKPTIVSKPIVTGTPVVGQQLAVAAGGWLSKSYPTFSYQWERCNSAGASCSAISGATSSTYVVQRADSGYMLLASVTASNSNGSSSATLSRVPSQEVSVDPSASIPVASSLPSITTSQPTIGVQVQASPGTWTNSPSTYSYQWKDCDSSGLNCTNISGASGSNVSASPTPTFTYTPVAADVGYTLRLSLTATTSNNDVGVAQSNPSAAVSGNAPVVSAVPTISGTATTGQVLAATNGTWTNTPTNYTYQWQSSPDNGVTWNNLSSTTASYQVQDSDLGNALRVQVTASNTYGQNTANSLATAKVSGLSPLNNTRPAITSGNVQDGVQVTASNGTWYGTTPLTYTYQWQTSPDQTTWTNINGATSQSYTIAYGTTPKYLRIQVTATNSSNSSTASSIGYQVIPVAPSNSAVPVISGTVQDTQTLSTTNGTWVGTPTIAYTYQWQTSPDGSTGWSNLASATSATYQVQSSDVGNYLRVQVTGTNATGNSAAVSAATTAVVGAPPSNTAAPSFTGTAEDGYTLNGANGTWIGTPTITYTYQWQYSTNGGSSWSNIGGATSINYTIPYNTYTGDLLRLQVKGTNSLGNSTASSTASAAVLASPPVNTVTPVTSGTGSWNSTLSTTTGTWAGQPTITYTYQWQTSSDNSTWANISAATSSTYVVAQTDYNNYIRVQVTGHNGMGTSTANSNSVQITHRWVDVNGTWKDIDATGVLTLPDAAGGDETFVPANSFSVSFKMWGAGGGLGAAPCGTGCSYTYTGGGGGEVTATLALVGGQSYILRIGGGGQSGYEFGTPMKGAAGFGGGAAGGAGSGSTYFTGGGGGMTGLFLTSVSQANALIIAGGGGGGGATNSATLSSVPGGGGGTTGGQFPYDGVSYGYDGFGGTQTAGGAKGNSGTNPGSAGVALVGGAGGTLSGGGGGGYYGGGGGSGAAANAGGGGGGSGYCSANAAVSNCVLTQGTDYWPASYTDSDIYPASPNYYAYGNTSAGYGGDGVAFLR